MASNFQYKIQNNQLRGALSDLRKYLVNTKQIEDSDLSFYKYLGVLPTNINQEGSSKMMTGTAREFSKIFKSNPQLQQQAIQNLGLNNPQKLQKLQSDFDNWNQNHVRNSNENDTTDSTNSKIKPKGIDLINTTLNLGSSGDQVKALQTYLAGIGYKNADGTPLKADGIYGPNTKTAVMQFQSSNGLAADGIFGPKSLAKTQEISSTGLTEGAGTKTSDDPSFQYNRDTGALNPNYDVNEVSRDIKPAFNTGNAEQDALLKELQDYIKTQQAAGLKINEALNFDQRTLDKFLETAKKQVHPFYQQQIDTIKQDVLRVAPQILQNYGNDIEKERAAFESGLGNFRENAAESGLAFSGQRARGELGMADEQNRNLVALSQGYGNKLYELGRGAEEKIGAGNMQGYDLGSLANYRANLGGSGGFTLGDSSSAYTPGGYKVGSIEYDREAATEARNQALKRSASESVVAGRDYKSLFG